MPAPVLAIDNAKTAVTMVQLAAKAYEAGDFAKAAEQDAKAWHLDPQPAYLWALARAEHLATLLDPATEHYRAFIALADAEPARVVKARQYLLEAEVELIKVRSRAAEAAMQSGKPALAAELYLSALKVVPTQMEFLFKAAVAEQMAEQWQSALEHFEGYLSRAPVDAPDRSQAVARQTWLRQKLGLKAQQATVAPVVQPVVVPPVEPAVKPPVQEPKPIQPAVAVALPNSAPPAIVPPNVAAPDQRPVRAVETVVHKPAERPTWPGWTLVGAGAALAVGGAALLIAVQSDANAITTAQQHAVGELITGVTYADAAARVSSANTRIGVGWALMGTGVVAAGVGTWLLLRGDSARSALLPTSNGAIWLVQF